MLNVGETPGVDLVRVFVCMGIQAILVFLVKVSKFILHYVFLKH